MSDLVEIKRKRFEFLHHLYEQSKGDQYKLFTLSDLAHDLQLDVKEAVLIAQYLEGEGLLQVIWTKGGGKDSQISITHLGVIQIEAAPGEPNKATDYFRDPPSATVFVVHGHDEAAKHSVARFIEHLGLDTTILHEQPDRGRTIIEKLEDHAQGTAFAVIILTADDRGGLSNVGYDEQKPRARQNVVMELGYFIGKLGRQKVRALYQEGVELPSDLQGVLYVTLDDGGAWKLQLAREMKAAGLNIDMNRAL